MRALVIIALVAGIAHAEDRAQAEAFYRAGERAFRKQLYEAAAANFEDAYKAAPLPEIAFSAAQSYRRQYFIEKTPRPDIAKRAIELYRIYLDKVTTEGRRGDASDGIAEMQRELDKHAGVTSAPVERAKPKTRIAVSVIIEGEEKRHIDELGTLPTSDLVKAIATLDGKPVELYSQIEVSDDRHVVDVTAEGFFPYREERPMVPGENNLFEARLKPKPAKLTIRASGRILVDGKRSSATQEITAGKHVVAVLARGHEPEVHELTLARGEEKTLAIDLEKTAQRRAVPWILIGSGAFAVTGIITTILAVHYDGVMSDIDDKRTTMGIDDGELGRYRTATRRRDLFRTTAFITGGTAIVLGGIGLGLYIFDQPDATGLGVGGRF